MDMSTAIRNGDVNALRQLLSEDASRANELISWGNYLSHPLHFVSDMLFEGALQRGKELPLVIRPQAAGSVFNTHVSFRRQSGNSIGCGVSCFA